MGLVDERLGHAGAGDRDADAVGEALDVGEPEVDQRGRRRAQHQQVEVGAEQRLLVVDALDRVDRERLDEDLVGALVAVREQRLEDLVLHHRIGLLGFRVDADLAAVARAQVARQRDDLLEGRDAVRVRRRRREARIGRRCGADRPHRQRLDLGQRELRDRVAAAAGKERLRIGRAGQRVVVHRDQHAVLRQLQVGLDVVGAELDRELVAAERVLGQVAAGAAVRDDDRRVAVQLLQVRGAGGRRERPRARPARPAAAARERTWVMEGNDSLLDVALEGSDPARASERVSSRTTR